MVGLFALCFSEGQSFDFMFFHFIMTNQISKTAANTKWGSSVWYKLISIRPCGSSILKQETVRQWHMLFQCSNWREKSTSLQGLQLNTFTGPEILLQDRNQNEKNPIYIRTQLHFFTVSATCTKKRLISIVLWLILPILDRIERH